MTMEFRVPGYFESFMVKVLDSDGTIDSVRGFGENAGPEAEGASHDGPFAPDHPYREDDCLHDPEV